MELVVRPAIEKYFLDLKDIRNTDLIETVNLTLIISKTNNILSLSFNIRLKDQKDQDDICNKYEDMICNQFGYKDNIKLQFGQIS